MNVEAQLAKLFAAADNGVGIHGVMRSEERAKGYRVVVPGDELWLPTEDWDPTIVVSIDRDRVRLVAILARRPGNGAFRRCVAGIQAAGLTPVVICPTLEMRETMKRWNWKGRTVGNGWESEEQWRPRKLHAPCKYAGD